jgi:hypothetical protein
MKIGNPRYLNDPELAVRVVQARRADTLRARSAWWPDCGEFEARLQRFCARLSCAQAGSHNMTSILNPARTVSDLQNMSLARATAAVHSAGLRSGRCC